MTRKKYIRNVQRMMIAIFNHPKSFYPDDYKLGEALKHIRDHAKEVPTKFGSYAAAWNSETMNWIKDHYGVN